MCLLYICIQDQERETALAFTAVVSMYVLVWRGKERERGADIRHMDYVIRCGLAYFCRETCLFYL